MLIERMRARVGSGLFVEGEEGAAGGGTTPTFVPTEAFMDFQKNVLQQFENLNSGIAAIRSSAVAAGARVDPVNDEPPVVTEEQYVEAIQAGDVKTMTAYKARQQFETLRAIAPQLQLGLNSVGAVVRESATATLPYYTRFKAQIDDVLAHMTPEMRMSAKAYEIAHNSVVGQNAKLIADEAVEAALRNANVDPKLANPGGGGGTRTVGGGGGGGQVPSVAELLGADAELALASKGDTPDSWSRKLGYKDWAGYAAEIKKQREGE